MILLQCLCALLAVVCVCKPTLASEDLRNDPRLPIQGTKNWELLTTKTSKFSPRHSHATCIFRCLDTDDSDCIWLTGGYSDEHRSYQGESENENADVWYSKDGKDWTQAMVSGDFHQGNVDAKEGGYTAPWFARYGHTLNALDYNGDGKSDVMVLIGGYSPTVSNDIWITTDGITWMFDDHAPFSKRGYHSATVFNGKLWVMGGSPLSNDVWSGTLLLLDNGRYHLDWEQVLPQAPWTSRAGSCLETQVSREMADDNSTLYTEHMFLLGGLAIDDKNETRTRNDVWKTQDGSTWEYIGEEMPWGSRAFHACASWSHLDDKSRWIGDSDEKEEYQPPRIFLTGGGFMGTKGNNEVRELKAYIDTWWSDDMRNWTRVNYQEGSIYQDNLYSTSEWTETYVNNRKIYRGKWGHTLEAHLTAVDEVDETETKLPSLFVIGGKLEGQEFTNDVFISKRGVHCEKNGITCSNNGICGEKACECHSGGSYCEPKKMPIMSI